MIYNAPPKTPDGGADAGRLRRRLRVPTKYGLHLAFIAAHKR